MPHVQSFWEHLQANLIVMFLAVFAVLLFIHFVVQYVVRGFLLRSALARLTKRVKALRGRPAGEVKGALEGIFEGSPAKFAWSEYEETLHEQYSTANGERRTSAIRATLPAEAFVSLETVVDPRIGSEYFKHLPGILTGFGIIGTFTGLIQGLLGFQPDLVDTQALTGSVKQLVGHVGDAFTFSGFAIGLAIVVTIVEKWLYSSCAKWVGLLSQSLDSLFRAGVGEEYLSGLLQATQDNATQVRQLKEAMVDDLKVLLTNLTDRQIQATQQLSTDLGHHIQSSLREPMAEIARTVRESTGRQTETVGTVLEELMTSFLAQMKEATGGQMTELAGLLRQTAGSIAGVELSMKALVADIQQAGQNSTTGMQEAVRGLMDTLAAHQRTQGDAVSAAMQSVMTGLQDSLSKLASAQEDAARRNADANTAVSKEMEERVRLVSDANAATMAATRETLDRIGSVSSDVIVQLSDGAKSVTTAVSALQGAADRMARVAQDLAGLGGQTSASSQAMTVATAQLAAAAQGLSNGMANLNLASTRLEGVAKAATVEADARSHLLKDLQEIIRQCQTASKEFGQLSEEVRKTLEISVEKFGTGVSKALSEQLGLYQRQLGTAVSMLKGVLDELVEYADTGNN